MPAASWIGYRTASDPAGSWSPEVALFQGAIPLPDSGSAQVNVSGLDASLGHLLLYSEPGAIAKGGTLYVSLTGLVQSGSDQIVMVASDDHAGSWRFVGAALSSQDASLLGYTDFDGTSIARQGGRTFLLASPGSPTRKRNGTLVFEFADLAAGTLVRDASGAPVVLAHVLPDGGYDNDVGGGQADYHEGNTAGGLLVNQLVLADLPSLFHIRQTGAALPVPEPQAAWLGALALAGLARRWRSAVG